MKKTILTLTAILALLSGCATNQPVQIDMSGTCKQYATATTDTTAEALYYAELYLEYTGAGVSNYTDLAKAQRLVHTAIAYGKQARAKCSAKYDAQLDSDKRQLAIIINALGM